MHLFHHLLFVTIPHQTLRCVEKSLLTWRVHGYIVHHHKCMLNSTAIVSRSCFDLAIKL
jgi:hypothetical protein